MQNNEGESDVSSLDAKFAPYRYLVPLLCHSDVVYLNSSHAPPSNLIVHEALTRFSFESLHDPNPKASWQAAAEDVRALVAKYINAEPSSIAFTRDTTEALGNFIRSIQFQLGDNVVILDSEHPNQGYGWMALRFAGLEVRQVPTITEAQKTGKVTAANAATFAPFVDERTRAIGISSIMFHSGQKNDVAGICRTFRPRGIHVLVDLTQQVGFAPVDVKALGVSAAGFSLHKGLNCPTGFACMYVDPDVLKAIDPIPPVVGYGAISNPRADLLVPNDPIIFHPNSRRFEHLNLSFIAAATAKAFLTFYLKSLGPSDLEEYLYSLGDELRKACQKLGVGIVGPSERKNHAPHLYILDLLDPGWTPHLRSHGIYVTEYRLGVRVSLGFYNNLTDIQRLANALSAGVANGLPLH
jgi:cysteine desulfurase/selenocysteine lyase